jgi:hypothetical protein
MNFPPLRAVIHLLIESTLFLSYPIIGALNYFLNDKIAHSKVKDGRTIIIVERWLNKNPFHLLWKRYLESKGFRVYLLFYPLSKSTFSQSAKNLKHFIDTNKLTDVTLVGISSGGITAFLYLHEYNGWNAVERFISIGVPFHGTLLALPLYLNRSCRDLLPWSSTVQKIKRTEITHKERVICIVSKFDELVSRSSAYLPGTREVVINVYGHNYLHLLAKDTYSTIATYAKKGL